MQILFERYLHEIALWILAAKYIITKSSVVLKEAKKSIYREYDPPRHDAKGHGDRYFQPTTYTSDLFSTSWYSGRHRYFWLKFWYHLDRRITLYLRSQIVLAYYSMINHAVTSLYSLLVSESSGKPLPRSRWHNSFSKGASSSSTTHQRACRLEVSKAKATPAPRDTFSPTIVYDRQWTLIPALARNNKNYASSPTPRRCSRRRWCTSFELCGKQFGRRRTVRRMALTRLGILYILRHRHNRDLREKYCHSRTQCRMWTYRLIVLRRMSFSQEVKGAYFPLRIITIFSKNIIDIEPTRSQLSQRDGEFKRQCWPPSYSLVQSQSQTWTRLCVSSFYMEVAMPAISLDTVVILKGDILFERECYKCFWFSLYSVGQFSW